MATALLRFTFTNAERAMHDNCIAAGTFFPHLRRNGVLLALRVLDGPEVRVGDTVQWIVELMWQEAADYGLVVGDTYDVTYGPKRIGAATVLRIDP